MHAPRYRPKPQHKLMGVYARMEGKELNGKGVWRELGKGPFLFRHTNNSALALAFGLLAGRDDIYRGPFTRGGHLRCTRCCCIQK